MKRFVFSLLCGAIGGCGALEAGEPGAETTWAAQGQPTVSLAGVHWYSGDQNMLDSGVAHGLRGWNVETVIGASDEGAISGSLQSARTARDHGLVNIIRIDYRPQLVVPLDEAQYGGWGDAFLRVVERFRAEGLSTRFIVGNEANIESCGQPGGCTSAERYARAYNYLLTRRPAGTEFLVAGPAAFAPNVRVQDGTGVFDYGGTFLDWLGAMAGALTAADGFALHSYGDPDECGDPGTTCLDASGRFSRNFVGFREQLARITRFGAKPVYLTEINTFTGNRHPQPNYRAGWINRAFAILRDYNGGRAAGQPAILAAAWFVDRDAGGWGDFALRNMPQARADLTQEFRDARNRGGGGGGSCASAALPTPGDRWKIEVFADPSLAGAPVEVRYEAAGAEGFRLDWGDGRASACAGTDRFGARFSRRASFAGGSYTFRATTDDGVRLWVDGRLVIDHWQDQAPTERTGQIDLGAGSHDLRMDYYENGGGAMAGLSWSRSGGPPPASCACRAGVNNFCHYPPNTAGCQMTSAGGYCDPNGDGGYGDADWVRGFNEFHAACP